jgi:hypothetical protein
MLSETASARIASPLTVKFEELRSREGYDPQKETPNFGPLWRGGEWHLSDITKTMTTAAFLLLNHAAEYRVQWLKRFYGIAKDAVRPRRNGELFGFIIEPPNKNNQMFFDILKRGDVEITDLPDGKKLVRMDQPYGAFAKALLEVQKYPNLRDETGHPIAPYDVTAHTLPLLMNVAVQPVKAPFKLARVGANTTAARSEETTPKPSPQLVALYRSAMPTFDEGWTRWLFESKSFQYGTLNEKELRAGITTFNLGRGVTGKYYVIVFPDQPPRNILDGYRAGSMPPELTGGLGVEGVKQLRAFIVQGGTAVFLNRASDFAIEQLKLPLRDIVASLPRTDFYVPGSILRIELDTTHPIAIGMPKDTIAWAENSPVFEVVENAGGDIPASNVHVIGWYPQDKDPLLSGWLLGGDRIKGKAALVEVTMGKGRVILFGFRPQYRAQSTATYPLFFNSLATNP